MLQQLQLFKKAIQKREILDGRQAESLKKQKGDNDADALSDAARKSEGYSHSAEGITQKKNKQDKESGFMLHIYSWYIVISEQEVLSRL